MGAKRKVRAFKSAALQHVRIKEQAVVMMASGFCPV